MGREAECSAAPASAGGAAARQPAAHRHYVVSGCVGGVRPTSPGPKISCCAGLPGESGWRWWRGTTATHPRHTRHTSQVMQHRHDYVEVEHSPPSKATSRAVGVAAGADRGVIVPLLLGKSGQHVPVAGETAQMEPTQVRVGRGREGSVCQPCLFFLLRSWWGGAAHGTHELCAAGGAAAGRRDVRLKSS
jgi:hypothetical protein